jgi:hypothetical protein
MTRSQLIRKLADFAGPLGPFETLEARAELRNQWLITADETLLDTLLDILVHPPDLKEFRPATGEDIDVELTEIFVLLGRHNPLELLRRVGPLLKNKKARSTIIEVIGAMKQQEGITWIKPLLDEKSLNEDELVRLAGAFGEIGGPEARLLLKQMRSSTSPKLTDVMEEIDIALQAVESPIEDQ